MAEKVSRLVGRQILDAHNRTVGRLVGYYANTKNEVTAIEIEMANGDFLNCPVSQIEIDGDSVVYNYPWELEANNLKRQFDLISRRTRALDELYKNGSIEKSIYGEMRAQHLSSIDELEEHKRILVESLNERSSKLDSQVKELELFLANIKMQHAAGEIDTETYNLAYEAVNVGFKRDLSEKTYLKDVMNFLNQVHLITGDDEERLDHALQDTSRIPDTVVVRMKETYA